VAKYQPGETVEYTSFNPDTGYSPATVVRYCDPGEYPHYNQPVLMITHGRSKKACLVEDSR
jgi:hypothetical protein